MSEAEWARLIDALIYVESRGNDLAHNKAENARGCLQIRQCVVDDYNMYNPRLTHIDVHDRATAIKVCRWYLQHWGGKFYAKYGHLESYRTKQEILARIWNGGPTGHSKLATIKYWHLVRNRL